MNRSKSAESYADPATITLFNNKRRDSMATVPLTELQFTERDKEILIVQKHAPCKMSPQIELWFPFLAPNPSNPFSLPRHPFLWRRESSWFFPYRTKYAPSMSFSHWKQESMSEFHRAYIQIQCNWTDNKHWKLTIVDWRALAYLSIWALIPMLRCFSASSELNHLVAKAWGSVLARKTERFPRAAAYRNKLVIVGRRKWCVTVRESEIWNCLDGVLSKVRRRKI